jgi:branched-chain amino acid transport system ATP-binding protein
LGNRLPAVLEIRGLRAGYGLRDVFSDLSFHIKQGELLGILGHNGAGKSTLLGTIAGTIPTRSGAVTLDGVAISNDSVRRRLESGIVYLPQGNPVFSQMTVAENLALRVPVGLSRREQQGKVEEVVSSFPRLISRKSQRAGSLSGGEKQMLCLAGALLSRPRFLLLDEPCLGLAPALVTQALHQFQQLVEQKGVGIILVEQKIREVLRVTDRLLIMRQGKVILDGPREEVAGDEDRLRELCL